MRTVYLLVLGWERFEIMHEEHLAQWLAHRRFFMTLNRLGLQYCPFLTSSPAASLWDLQGSASSLIPTVPPPYDFLKESLWNIHPYPQLTKTIKRKLNSLSWAPRPLSVWTLPTSPTSTCLLWALTMPGHLLLPSYAKFLNDHTCLSLPTKPFPSFLQLP